MSAENAQPPTDGAEPSAPNTHAVGIRENQPLAPAPAAKSLRMPVIVTQAFLSKARTVHGVTLQPFSFDALLLLDAIGNRLIAPPAQGFTPTLTEIAQGIFILAAPDAAAELAEPGSAGGFSELDRAAMRFIREKKIAPYMLENFARAIGQLIAEGLAAAPGAGEENPPVTGPA
jgi:hypothetical protein